LKGRGLLFEKQKLVSSWHMGHSTSKNKISRISKIWFLNIIFKNSKNLIFNNCNIIEE